MRSRPFDFAQSRLCQCSRSRHQRYIPCYSESVPMPPFPQNSAFTRVTALAARRPIHAAFAWLHANPKTIMDWQMELVAIPAPPFGEQARAEWLAARFAEAGLSDVEYRRRGQRTWHRARREVAARKHGTGCAALGASRYRVSGRNAAASRCLRVSVCKLRALATTGPAWQACSPSSMRCSTPKWNCRRRSPCWEMSEKKARATCAACATSTSTAPWPAASPHTSFWMAPAQTQP